MRNRRQPNARPRRVLSTPNRVACAFQAAGPIFKEQIMRRSPIPVTAKVADTLIVRADGQEAVNITLWTGLASDGAASGYERRQTAWLQAFVGKDPRPIIWRFGGKRYRLAHKAFRDLCDNVARPPAERRPFNYRTGLVA